MSRAAIIVALARVLQRQPTPEEFDAFRLTLLQACPEGRVYLSPQTPSACERRDEIQRLRHTGMSIRAIARELKCHRREVRDAVGPNLALSWPHP
jgi:DNA-binding NarL/FixJ family response regulator